jgi:hypothetical protein
MYTNLSIERPPKVSAEWKLNDYLGNIKVRLSFGRDNYKVKPGLYSFENPGSESPVFVSANYKLSFDILRQSLSGLSAWILVLDTHGINVWCAAGKGTFGTDELIGQIESTNLKEVVTHRQLIVPQLGAPGVAAHLVKLATGFQIKFGPVKASDIKNYMETGMKKTVPMRTVTFNLIERLKVIPVEFMTSLAKFVAIAILFVLLSGISNNGFSLQSLTGLGIKVLAILTLAYVSGIIISPMLLPWIPFRSFSAKGMFTGAITIIFVMVSSNLFEGYLIQLALFLTGISISSFLAMNFTGTSTYTSLSGVRKEMGVFVPIQLIFSSLGLILFVVSRFINW